MTPSVSSNRLQTDLYAKHSGQQKCRAPLNRLTKLNLINEPKNFPIYLNGSTFFSLSDHVYR